MKKSDAELIDEILSGDEDAFSALVQKYQKSVHALVWRKIGDFHIAEEITQDTFLQVYKKLPTLKNPRQFAGWLYVIVNRQCIAWFRKNNIQAEQSLAMEFTPNADKIVYGGRGKVGLIDADTGIQLNYWESHNYQTPVKLSPKGEKLAIGSNNNRILLVDLKSGDITKTLIDQTTGNKAVIICLAFSLDGNLLVCGSSGNKVRIWNMQTDQLLQTLIGHTDLVRSIVFAPNGETVPSGGWKDDSKIRLWNVHSGQLLHTIYSTSKRVYSLAYSPDGKILASGNSNGSIGLWDPNTGENIKLLPGHTSWVNSIDYSPDGKTLASVSDDGTVLLWDLTKL